MRGGVRLLHTSTRLAKVWRCLKPSKRFGWGFCAHTQRMCTWFDHVSRFHCGYTEKNRLGQFKAWALDSQGITMSSLSQCFIFNSVTVTVYTQTSQMENHILYNFTGSPLAVVTAHIHCGTSACSLTTFISIRNRISSLPRSSCWWESWNAPQGFRVKVSTLWLPIMLPEPPTEPWHCHLGIWSCHQRGKKSIDGKTCWCCLLSLHHDALIALEQHKSQLIRPHKAFSHFSRVQSFCSRAKWSFFPISLTDKWLS